MVEYKPSDEEKSGAYSYGPGFPLALTAQYSGGGLWGRDYRITGPLELRIAGDVICVALPRFGFKTIRR